MTARRLASTAGLCLVLAATGASAQELPRSPQGAQPGAWIDEGIRLRGERRDEEALAQFRRAWEAEHRPEALAQIALAEQALGRWVDAEHDLARATGSVGDPWIQRNRANLDAALAEIRQHLGTLEVRSRVAGSRVVVNGHDEGSLPLRTPLRVVVGSVSVDVTAAGYVTARRVVEVRPGDDLVEEFELVALAPPVARASPEVVSMAVVAPQQLADASVHPMRAWGAGLLIGAGVLLAGGVGALAWREVSAADFNAPRAPPCIVDVAAPDVVYGGPGCASLRSQTDTAGTLSIVGFVAAGALATGGLVLLLTAPRAPRRAAVHCAPGPLSVTCGVSF